MNYRAFVLLPSVVLINCSPSNYPSLHSYMASPSTYWSTYASRSAEVCGSEQVKHQTPTDAAVLSYGSYLCDTLFVRSRNARVAREASNSTIIGLATATAAGSSFGFAQETLVRLGLASSTVGSFQNLFKANERSKHYQNASTRIRNHIQEYHSTFSISTAPSSERLTVGGAALLKHINLECDIVYNHLIDQIPDDQMMIDYVKPLLKTATEINDKLEKAKVDGIIQTDSQGEPTPSDSDTIPEAPVF